MHFIGISGSPRSVSYNTALLRAAFEELPDGVTAEIVTLEAIPMYDWEYERSRGFPEPVAELRDRIAGADAIILASPEYNFSVTGVLKNAIDWLSRGPFSPLDFKPAAIIGAGGSGGTRRSQQHLREILQHNNLRVLAEPEVLVPRARMHFDGLELTNEGVRADLRLMLEGLVALVERVGGTSPPEVRGSVLIAAGDTPRVDRLARQAAEHGYRTLNATTAVDAALLIAERTIAAAVIDEAFDPEEVARIRETLGRHHPDAPLLLVGDAGLIGTTLDDDLRFQVVAQ